MEAYGHEGMEAYGRGVIRAMVHGVVGACVFSWTVSVVGTRGIGREGGSASRLGVRSQISVLIAPHDAVQQVFRSEDSPWESCQGRSLMCFLGIFGTRECFWIF